MPAPAYVLGFALFFCILSPTSPAIDTARQDGWGLSASLAPQWLERDGYAHFRIFFAYLTAYLAVQRQCTLFVVSQPESLAGIETYDMAADTPEKKKKLENIGIADAGDYQTATNRAWRVFEMLLSPSRTSAPSSL